MKRNKILISFILTFFALFFVYAMVESYIVEQYVHYELTILDLKQEIVDNQVTYEKTIKEIIKNIQVADSYLFTGGYSDLDSDNEFDLDSYISLLTMETDFDYLLEETVNFFNNRNEYLSEIPNIFPIPYSIDNRITSLYGQRISPITGKIVEHNGIDIMASYGTPIMVTADGIVKAYYPNHWLYGRLLVVKHANGYETWYAHLDKNYVHRGDKVIQGEVIGTMGNSGSSFGIHLHYMVLKDGEPQNPIFYLRSQIN